jgi:glycerol-3-phosphate acyltransferase PlsY
MTAAPVAMIGLAYLLGSIPTGFIVGTWAGVDVRKHGSGNVGATNVARVLGKRQGVYTLIADAAKGFVPAFIAVRMEFPTAVTALIGIAAFMGHLFPVFLKFKGGKGVATAFGLFTALAPVATLTLVALFAAVMAASRRVSLSSMIAAAGAPLIFWWFSYHPAVVATGALLAAMILVRHRSNIQRLLAGTEPKFGG